MLSEFVLHKWLYYIIIYTDDVTVETGSSILKTIIFSYLKTGSLSLICKLTLSY